MLDQSGEYRIAASRDAVWAALNDPDVLGACITGCQEMTRVDDTHFEARVKAKIGPVSATFDAAIELSDLNPPESYVIQGNVKGGAAGFAKGGAEVALSDLDAKNTLLNYSVSANVGGKLAQIGSRLVDGAARKMADEFFTAFQDHMTSGNEPVDEAGSSQDAVAGDTGLKQNEAGSGDIGSDEKNEQWKIWAIAFGVLALAILLAF